MPANLTAEAKGLWSKAIQARTAKEKIKTLQEFLSAVPKHKGNERLRAQVKRKIAVLRLEESEREKRKTSKGGAGWSIQKEGAAQIVLIGDTSVGKSSLLSALTNATPTIAASRFTTTRPVPGIMNFEDVQFQLVETPALVKGASDGVGWGLRTLGLTRNADGIIIVLDLSERPQDQLKMVLNEMENARVSLKQSISHISISRAKGGEGVQVAVSGRLVDCDIEGVQKLAKEYGLNNALVRISGEARLNDVEDALLESTSIYKPAVLVANKLDLPSARQNLEELSKTMTDLPVIPVSCMTRENLHLIGGAVFKALAIIRVYTKELNENTHSTEPFILHANSTVAELAKRIHTELYENFRFARVWGSTAKYPGERVGLGHVLLDRDIVEIHAK